MTATLVADTVFVGHALLAFAVAALVADWRGWARRDALWVGAVAGAFAAVPDVDVAYALVELADRGAAGGAATASPATFWDATRGVHRSATHSLVVAALAVPVFGLLAVRGRGGRARLGVAVAAAAALAGALVIGALVADGPATAFVLAAFLAAGALVSRIAARASALSPPAVAAAALWGLWSHPWGDLVTGSPPDWFFPAGSPALDARVVLHPDPTLHLLGAFALELAAVWLAAVACCRLAGRPVLGSIDRRASVGAAYGVVALAAAPPTLAVSYHFVFSILGVGALCGAVRAAPLTPLDRLASVDRRVPRRAPSADAALAVALTALAGVTVALVAYAAVYLLADAGATALVLPW